MSKNKIMLVALLAPMLAVATAQIPAEYYTPADSKTNTELKTALYQIIKVGTRLSYGSGSSSTWSGFEQCDRRPDGYVWDMYSNNQVAFPGNGKAPSGMNIEHSLAKSWWGGTKNDAYKDLYHLNPSNSTANSARGSYPPGLVNGNGSFNNGSFKVGNNASDASYTGMCFEPDDEYKGDFARAYFYMVTCYENLSFIGNSNAKTAMSDTEKPLWFKPWLRQLLLEWHRTDPVSEKEINRQVAIYNIQHNRNPYIDYPCLVEYIWGNRTDETVDFSSLMNTLDDEYASAEDQSGCDCSITVPTITAPRRNVTVAVGAANLNETITTTIPLKGVLLTQAISATLSGANAAQFALSANSFSAADMLAGTSVDLTYHPTALGQHTAILTLNSAELAAPLTVNVTGTCLAELTAPDTMGIDFASTDVAERQQRAVLLKGTNLASSVQLSLVGSDADHFTLSRTVLTAAEVMTGSTIDLSFEPRIAGSYTAELQVQSSDFETVRVPILGECTFMALEPIDVGATNFTARWTNMGATNYTLHVYTKAITGTQEISLLKVDQLSTDKVSSESHLSTTGNVYNETNALRLGTGSGDGTLRISGLDLHEGGKLLVNARSFGSDNSTLKVSVGSTVVGTLQLTSSFANYEMPLLASADDIIYLSQGNSGQRVIVASLEVQAGGIVMSNVPVAGFPKSVGNVLSYTVTNLPTDQMYYYMVQPDGYSLSEEIDVPLGEVADVPQTSALGLLCTISNGQLLVRNAPVGSTLTLFDALGRKLMLQTAFGEAQFDLPTHGVYLLRAEADGAFETIKVSY